MRTVEGRNALIFGRLGRTDIHRFSICSCTAVQKHRNFDHFFVVHRKGQIKVLWNTNRKSYVIHRTVTSDGHLSYESFLRGQYFDKAYLVCEVD